MRKSFILAAVLALAVAMPASAQGPSPSLEEIRKQQTDLREAARAGSGVFEELPGADRTRLVEHQDAVLTMIEGKQDVEDLDEPVRMDVFNRLEEIRALVEKAEDSRVVCEYKKKVGTHMKARVCQTVAERRREREQAVDIMNQRAICGNFKGI